MRTLKYILLSVLALALALPSQARKKPNYQITLTIQNGRDSMLLLGYYFAKGNRVVDTAYKDSKGRFVFSSTADTLPQGLCFFANKDGNYADFVVYHEKPFFSFETREENWSQYMKVKGSAQNEFFLDFTRLDSEIGMDLNAKHRTLDSAAFEKYKNEKLIALDSIKSVLVENNPDMFLVKMLLVNKDIVPPVVDEKGDSLSDFQRRELYMAHYFDNIALEDNAIIHTPKAVFYDRVMSYFDKQLKYAPPQYIIEHIDPMLDRAKAAPDVFMYLVNTLTQKYLQSPVMVYDEVYVHLVQKYYASDDNFWSSPSSIEKETIRAAKWDRLLVGREAPELILYDTLRVPHSLHSLDAKWKLLVFWSPNCGHCQHIIPEVYRVFEQYHEQYNIVAFTILSDPDDKTRKEWKTFLKEHDMTDPAWLSLDGGEANVDWHDVYDITSTPQIYLIDENNIIQAKKLGETSIENVIKAVCGSEMSNE